MFSDITLTILNYKQPLRKYRREFKKINKNHFLANGNASDTPLPKIPAHKSLSKKINTSKTPLYKESIFK